MITRRKFQLSILILSILLFLVIVVFYPKRDFSFWSMLVSNVLVAIAMLKSLRTPKS